MALVPPMCNVRPFVPLVYNLIFPSKVWTKKCTLYSTKYSTRVEYISVKINENSVQTLNSFILTGREM